MTLLVIALFGGIGLALGLAHFHGLRRDVRSYLGGGVRFGAIVAHAARVLATAAAFVFIARIGVIPLLAGLGGFVLAKLIAVTRARRST
jgi:hypothetical protein